MENKITTGLLSSELLQVEVNYLNGRGRVDDDMRLPLNHSGSNHSFLIIVHLAKCLRITKEAALTGSE